MKLMKTTIVMAAGGLLLVGCATDKSSIKDFFPSDCCRKLNQIADAQAAKGAKEDATLQPAHFDGSKLNSLGEAKLDAMLPDKHDADVKVFLNLSENADETAARKDAVSAYLESKGMDAANVKIEMGPNPGLTTPSALGLAGLAKTDTAAAGAAPDAAAAEGMK